MDCVVPIWVRLKGPIQNPLILSLHSSAYGILQTKGLVLSNSVEANASGALKLRLPDGCICNDLEST